MKSSRIISITPQFSKKQIEAYVAGQMVRIESALLSSIKRVGEKFIINARSTKTYQNQTGNLRASIGYIIYKDGKRLTENFTGDTAKGQQAARTVADLLKRKHTKGFVLIGVAGMEYALAVESRGLDVITGSSQIAIEDLKNALTELQNKVNKK